VVPALIQYMSSVLFSVTTGTHGGWDSTHFLVQVFVKSVVARPQAENDYLL